MINIKFAEFIINIISFLFAYTIAVTLANAFRAWVADRVGDYTPRSLGFLTLNPAVHIDPFGVMVLFLVYIFLGDFFGWGRFIPINPFNIDEPWRKAKLVFVYLSDTIAHFILALLGLVLLIALFDIRIVDITRYMVLTRNLSHLYIAHMYPDISSWIVSAGFIIMATVYLNFILGVLDLIINSCNIAIFVMSEQEPQRMMQPTWLTIALPMILILFFSGPLRLLAVNFISYIGYAIAYMLGVA